MESDEYYYCYTVKERGNWTYLRSPPSISDPNWTDLLVSALLSSKVEDICQSKLECLEHCSSLWKLKIPGNENSLRLKLPAPGSPLGLEAVNGVSMKESAFCVSVVSWESSGGML